jgi:tRNA G46 methylase TrmB
MKVLLVTLAVLPLLVAVTRPPPKAFATNDNNKKWRLKTNERSRVFDTLAKAFHCCTRQVPAKPLLISSLPSDIYSEHGIYQVYSVNPQKTDAATRYTIDGDQARTSPARITVERTVRKHCDSLSVYLEHRANPAAHTLAAFESLQTQLAEIDVDSDLILDSGCGTGRSSILLGSLHPECIVIGVDRSLARLSKLQTVGNCSSGQQHRPTRDSRMSPSSRGDGATLMYGEFAVDDRGPDHDDSCVARDSNDMHSAGSVMLRRAAENVWLVRAELADFWRCLLDAEIRYRHEMPGSNESVPTIFPLRASRVQQHFVLYPNPYPKASRWKSRFYGQASFPLLLAVSGRRLTIRSNWKQYLMEFAHAVRMTSDYFVGASLLSAGDGQHSDRRLHARHSVISTILSNVTWVVAERNKAVASVSQAWTNFEEKYHAIGEPTYEIQFTAAADIVEPS